MAGIGWGALTASWRVRKTADVPRKLERGNQTSSLYMLLAISNVHPYEHVTARPEDVS